jgi:hypothetical protein
MNPVVQEGPHIPSEEIHLDKNTNDKLDVATRGNEIETIRFNSAGTSHPV